LRLSRKSICRGRMKRQVQRQEVTNRIDTSADG
jgi:hypothetical protein